MQEIVRPLTITPSYRGESIVKGRFFISGPDRICDACGARTNSYAETREEGAPWDMTICATDFFANADMDGAKIEIN